MHPKQRQQCSPTGDKMIDKRIWVHNSYLGKETCQTVPAWTDHCPDGFADVWFEELVPYVPDAALSKLVAALKQVMDHPSVRTCIRDGDSCPPCPASLWIDLTRAFDAVNEMEKT